MNRIYRMLGNFTGQQAKGIAAKRRRMQKEETANEREWGRRQLRVLVEPKSDGPVRT